MYNEAEFIEAAELAYQNIDRPVGSTKKSRNRLRSVQEQVLVSIRDVFPENVTSNGPKLEGVEGFYHRKQFPIVIRKRGEPKLCIGTKFTLGGYESNIINYFQSVLGESVNLQKTGIQYASIQIIPTKIRQTTNGVVRWEDIDPLHFVKFFRLMQENTHPYTPVALGCAIVDIDYANKTIIPADLQNIFDQNQRQLFQQHLSMEQFFVKIEAISAAL